MQLLKTSRAAQKASELRKSPKATVGYGIWLHWDLVSQRRAELQLLQHLTSPGKKKRLATRVFTPKLDHCTDIRRIIFVFHAALYSSNLMGCIFGNIAHPHPRVDY